MDAASLRQLREEREARRGAPLPASWAAKPTPTPRSTSLPPASLTSAHRSIRLARSLGLALVLLACLLLLLGVGWRVCVFTVLGGIGMARGGGALLHGLLPGTLVEVARPPTATEMTAASAVGLWCPAGLKTFGASSEAEYNLALDSLAFCCTYGRKNCLTDAMYSGPPMPLKNWLIPRP